jgi:hypothetical protein
MVAGARALLTGIRDASIAAPPLGLGQLLTGETPAFPLDRAVPHAIAVATACEADDPAALRLAAEPLLGLGPGLTPSGDDFVGGVLFARRLAGGDTGPGWERAALTLVERARARTHPISVALLADMAEGHGHEPLHDLVAALLSGAAAPGAREPVRRLTRLGHSSGWDMLTGVLAGVLGSAALQPRDRAGAGAAGRRRA